MRKLIGWFFTDVMGEKDVSDEVQEIATGGFVTLLCWLLISMSLLSFALDVNYIQLKEKPVSSVLTF